MNLVVNVSEKQNRSSEEMSFQMIQIPDLWDIHYLRETKKIRNCIILSLIHIIILNWMFMNNICFQYASQKIAIAAYYLTSRLLKWQLCLSKVHSQLKMLESKILIFPHLGPLIVSRSGDCGVTNWLRWKYEINLERCGVRCPDPGTDTTLAPGS